MMMNTQNIKSPGTLDVVIIGAGPIGLACAIEAKKHELSYLVLEKGCLVNSIFHFPHNMTFFSTADRLEIGSVPFISHNDKPTRREALEYYRRVVKAWELNVYTYERVMDIHPGDTSFQVCSEKDTYQTRAVIIATGFYDHPNKMNVPGENLVKVSHYFRDAHPFAFQKVMVVGGGNSAVDTALECFRKGAEVTMVIRSAELEDNVKYWVKPDLENRIKEGSIKAYYYSSIKEIREKEVDIITPKNTITVENDFLFAMTGYHPDYEFLQEVGIDCYQQEDRTPCFNPDTFETPQAGIYLAGVVCGGMNTSKWFIENARHQPQVIFQHMIKGS